jgi:hypothetical protein
MMYLQLVSDRFRDDDVDAVTGNPVLVDNNTNVEMYVQSMDNSRNITKNRQENVDQQIGTTTALEDC